MTALENISSGVSSAKCSRANLEFYIVRDDNNCIEFDISTTITSGKDGKIGIIKVVEFGRNTSVSHKEITRIKFRVKERPVAR